MFFLMLQETDSFVMNMFRGKMNTKELFPFPDGNTLSHNVLSQASSR